MFSLFHFRTSRGSRERSPERTQSARRPQGGARLELEALEDRTLPSVTGAAFLVNTATANLQWGALSASSSNDQSVVVWNHQTSPTNNDIRARIYDASGNALTSEFSITSTVRNEEVGGVAMDAQGNIVVTWTESLDTTRTVKAQRFSAAGASLGSVITVSTSTNAAAAFTWYAPQVATTSGSLFVVTYVTVGANGDTDVQASMFSGASGALQRTLTVSASTMDRETHPTIAMDDSNRFAIAYRVGQVGAGRIELKEFGKDGALLTTVGVTNGTKDSMPSVAMDRAGNMVVAWGNIDGAPIQARKISATGVLGNIITVGTTNTDAYPKVAMHPTNGSFVVGYMSLSATSAASHAVKVAEVDASGSVQTYTLAAMGTANAPAWVGGVSVSSTGRYFVTYAATNALDSDGGIFGQYGQPWASTVSTVRQAPPGSIPIPSVPPRVAFSPWLHL